MKSKIRITIPNGDYVEFDGEYIIKEQENSNQVPHDFPFTWNEVPHYYSDSKGKHIPVSEMNTQHLRNAIKKNLKTLFGVDYCSFGVLMNVLDDEKLILGDLVREYMSREDR